VQSLILSRNLWFWLAVLVLGAGPLLADAPETSIRPLPRPVMAETAVAGDAVAKAAAPAVIRPRPRPEGLLAAVAPVAAAPAPAPAPETVAVLRPRPRPEGLLEAPVEEIAASPTQKKPKREKASKKGSVCGDPAIKGEKLATIKSKVKGCGVSEPVRVTSIDGIRLSQPATMDCDTAIALKTWVQQAMRPAFGRREVVELRIAAHYICRPRNNVKGNKISEHGRGKAIDIAGFIFSDGKEWTVARDYNKQIRKAHKGACGIFGTTLGPGSDGYHEDHLHFDTASYRGGPYCR
jgi:hypothetical protein